MTRTRTRTLARLALVAAVTYVVCIMWTSAPVILVLLDIPFRADFVIGLMAGAWLTAR